MKSKKSAISGDLWGRICRLVVGTAIVLAFSIVMAELVARNIFGLSPLVYKRPFHPLFVAADSVAPAKLSSLSDAPGGPAPLGYWPDGLTFHTDPEAPLKAAPAP